MQENYSDELVDWLSNCRFDDIPEQTVDYAKLVLLDSIICGIAAGGLERSKMLTAVYEQLGNQPDARILGTDKKLSAPHAAAVNCESMNLLDADDTFFTASHFAAFNAAAALAEADRSQSSGRDLLRSMILGYDINARIFLSQVAIIQTDDGRFEYSPVQGMGFAAFGTAISSALQRPLDTEQLRRLLGVTGWMAPTPSCNPQAKKHEHHSFKYANYSAAALAGMLAVHYTEAGYSAQDDILDSGAFMRAQGCLDTDLELLTLDLGSKWWIDESCIKYYPSCRYTSAPIDMLLELMRDEQLRPDDIDHIDIEMNSVAYAMQMFSNPASQITDDHRAPLNGAFNIPYVVAVAALGHTPGPNWYESSNLLDKDIWAFAKKISTSENQGSIDAITRALNESRIRRFRKNPSAMTVTARGREYRLASDYAQGDPWQDSTKASWDSIGEKFENFCGDLIGSSSIDRITQSIKQLESRGHATNALY